MSYRGGGVKLQKVLLQLAKGGAESKAVEAGEIDAVIDRVGSNVILLPAARRALLEVANEAPIANSLLAALPRADYQSLLTGLEPLTLRFGAVLHEPDARIEHVYFPVDCMISLMATGADREELEVGVIGYEGMIGISVALGKDVASARAVVRASGTVLRMSAQRFRSALRQCPPIQIEIFRYAAAKLAWARQALVCYRFHTTEERLARALLISADRLRSEELFLTQALLARVLGVRRATVNEAAGPLQQRNLISYSRGRIRILDREGLEAASCRCYAKTLPANNPSYV
jgi:CRP-like cAMP-binding protein